MACTAFDYRSGSPIMPHACALIYAAPNTTQGMDLKIYYQPWIKRQMLSCVFFKLNDIISIDPVLVKRLLIQRRYTLKPAICVIIHMTIQTNFYLKIQCRIKSAKNHAFYSEGIQRMHLYALHYARVCSMMISYIINRSTIYLTIDYKS